MTTKSKPKWIEVLESREGASMASSWIEYLCLCQGDNKRYRLFIGQYEALAEASDYYDEETEEYNLPTHIEGMEVKAVHDDYVVGGELTWHSDDLTVEFDRASEPEVVTWIRDNEWQSETIKAHLAALDSGHATEN